MAGLTTLLLAGAAAAATAKQAVDAGKARKEAQEAADKETARQNQLKAQADAQVDAEDAASASRAAAAIARQRGGAILGNSSNTGMQSPQGSTLGAAGTSGLMLGSLASPLAPPSTGGTKTTLGS